MAKRKLETPTVDDTGAEEIEVRVGRRRRDVPMSRITLSLEAETVKKLRFAAISEGVDPCVIVERLLKPFVRPYVLSIRDRRLESEAETAA